MSVKPIGPAIEDPTPGGLPPVVVGGGYQSDGDDATYIEVAQRKVSESATNVNTGEYSWDFTPDPALPASAVIRARVTIVDDTLIEAFSAAQFVIALARSDSVILTTLGAWDTYADAEVGVARWATFTTFLTTDRLDALRTGAYLGTPVRLMATFGTNATSTAPVGSEARVRLHEFYIGPIAAPPLRRYPGGTATPRLYPRPVTRRPGTY